MEGSLSVCQADDRNYHKVKHDTAHRDSLMNALLAGAVSSDNIGTRAACVPACVRKGTYQTGRTFICVFIMQGECI